MAGLERLRAAIRQRSTTASLLLCRAKIRNVSRRAPDIREAETLLANLERIFTSDAHLASFKNEMMDMITLIMQVLAEAKHINLQDTMVESIRRQYSALCFS